LKKHLDFKDTALVEFNPRNLHGRKAQTAFRITISNTKYQAIGLLDITFSEMILEGQINHLKQIN
jgi:hypothetical protein